MHKIVFGVVAISILIGGAACNHADNAANLKLAPQWIALTSDAGGFSISMPAQPKATDARTMNPNLNWLAIHKPVTALIFQITTGSPSVNLEDKHVTTFTKLFDSRMRFDPVQYVLN